MALFDHPGIEHYAFEDVPLDRDIFLMGEKWMAKYSKALIDGLNGKKWRTTDVGYISYAAARRISEHSIELSWYPNVATRFHEMRVHLPRSSFLCCVGCRNYDEKARIFIKDEWLADLHKRTNSVFVMVDADGVKNALTRCAISNEQLMDLQHKLDNIASRHPDIALVSFADSLLIKANWSVGMYNDPTTAEYEPEHVLHVLPEIAEAYRLTLDLDIYAVVTQGRNEFYSSDLMHISPSKNHISLNSLGIPFAQLQAIESAARKAVKAGWHQKASLYMDDQFFHSLRWRGYDKNSEPKHPYPAPMAGDCQYVALDLTESLRLLPMNSDK